ncbi:hypothetical protein E1295_05650 [Nonomuraea mesophila]|uniref:Uncharacterized protein n=1 Tax=Nonomuraea mesophila TaxID=2530382 RepID=A0A4R5FWR2_9ACTN|nr:hypothetical protein [Nonomuraea mesophila]TDE58440.1 hypothetical protein E1295_05650 [Nonomuraea mesophila]
MPEGYDVLLRDGEIPLHPVGPNATLVAGPACQAKVPEGSTWRAHTDSTGSQRGAAYRPVISTDPDGRATMRTRTIIAAGVFAAAATLASPAPAQAAAPSCLTYKLDDSGAKDTLWVWNTCKGAKSYKVRLANGQDLHCSYKRPGSGYTKWWWNWPRRFDGLVSC